MRAYASSAAAAAHYYTRARCSPKESCIYSGAPCRRRYNHRTLHTHVASTHQHTSRTPTVGPESKTRPIHTRTAPAANVLRLSFYLSPLSSSSSSSSSSPFFNKRILLCFIIYFKILYYIIDNYYYYLTR